MTFSKYELKKSWADLTDGFKKHEVWSALAFEDIRSRYMRSFGGIGWIFLSFAFFVLVKIIIFGPTSGKNSAFFGPYVVIGFFIYMFMSTTIQEGCATFISAKGWIKGAKIPLSVFALKALARNCILAAINFLVVILVILYFKPDITWFALWSFPLFGLLILNGIWVTLMFATIGARYRDFVHACNTVMRVMLFLTPIFWVPENIGPMWDKLLKYNPLSHFLILVRDPVLYHRIPMDSFIVVLSITVVGFVTSAFVFIYGRPRVPFWI